MAKSTFRFAVILEHRHCLLTKFEEEWLLRGLVGIEDNSVYPFQRILGLNCW